VPGRRRVRISPTIGSAATRLTRMQGFASLLVLCVLCMSDPVAAWKVQLGRRVVLSGAAAASLSVWPPAKAMAADKSILERAKENQLSPELAIERARKGQLLTPADLEQFDCVTLQRLIDVDKQAVKKQAAKVEKMRSYVGNLVSDSAEEALEKKLKKDESTLDTIIKAVGEQVERLEEIRSQRGSNCAA